MPATYSAKTRQSINEKFSEILSTASGTGSLSNSIEQAVVDLAVRSEENRQYTVKMDDLPDLSITFENALA